MKKWLKDTLSVINGFRKYSFMLLLIIVAVIFRVFNLLNGLEFVDLMKGTTIAFLTSNGIEHMTKVVKEFITKKAKD